MRARREDLLEGYELFREFDRSTFALCEPLRAMRIVRLDAFATATEMLAAHVVRTHRSSEPFGSLNTSPSVKYRAER